MATPVNLVFRDRRIASVRMIGPGELFDVTAAAGDRIHMGGISHPEKELQTLAGRENFSLFAMLEAPNRYHVL